MGYPVAECAPDGTAVITKPAGTGGLVTPATVGEQIRYEIGDPGAYLMADVTCDWREVRLTQDAPIACASRVPVVREATTTYKATATSVIGYRALTTAMFAGVGAAGKARRMAEALISRVGRLAAAQGSEPLTESSIEVVGTGDVRGTAGTTPPPRPSSRSGWRARTRPRSSCSSRSNRFTELALMPCCSARSAIVRRPGRT